MHKALYNIYSNVHIYITALQGTMVPLRTSSFSDMSKLRDKPDATGWPHNFCSILSKSDVAKKGERAGGRVKVKTRKKFYLATALHVLLAVLALITTPDNRTESRQHVPNVVSMAAMPWRPGASSPLKCVIR